MREKRILTFQDVSCVGQCSLTVALPIISACGIETCILPSAVLSTHTGSGFTGYTFRDLTEDILPIASHWRREGLTFDAVYTGYLGNASQIEYAQTIMDCLLNDGGLRIVDPAMADNGKLYYGFDDKHVENMKKLCSVSDIVLPNITEAAMLTDMEYKASDYSKGYIEEIIGKLTDMGCKSVVLTGVSFDEGNLGVAVCENGTVDYYFHKKVPYSLHGTGDIFASIFTGALMSGHTIMDSARIAGDMTLLAIEETKDRDIHPYGARFEKIIPELIRRVGGQ